MSCLLCQFKKLILSEIVLHFIMSQGVLRDDRRWMLKKSQIRIVLSNYPVHEIIVLDDIKGL